MNINKNKTVGIVGLGLIGGSIGIALLDNINNNYYVIGFDHNKRHEEEAIKLKLINKIGNLNEILNCDIIFLAIPVEGIVNFLKNLNLNDIRPETTIIDLGSTKSEIIKSIPHQIRKNFVASHPMAGTEKSGPSASLKNLYLNRVAVLCNLEDSGEIQQRESIEIFKFLGMRIVKMDGEEHDRHVSWISHLPHVLSFSLANSVLKQENPESIINLAAGGFRDMSRLAKSSPKMWRDIFQQNRVNLLNSIDNFMKELYNFRDLIEKTDWEKVEEKMENANSLHKIL